MKGHALVSMRGILFVTALPKFPGVVWQKSV